MMKNRGGRLVFRCIATLACCILLANSPVTAATKSPTPGGDSGLAGLIAQVEKAADEVESFHCRFRQEKVLAIFQSPVIFEGELRVTRPDRLRWEFMSPVPSVLIFDGDMGMRCGEKSVPVHFDLRTDPVMKSVAQQLRLWLGGEYDHLSKMYTMEKKGDSSIVLQPKKQAVQEFIQSVVITFDNDTKQPKRVEIYEPGGDLTRLSFFGYNINPGFPDIVFKDCGIDD